MDVEELRGGNEGSPPSSLFESFERLARRDPAKPALREPETKLRLTRQALLDRVAITADALRRDGFRAGSVAVVHASGVSFVIAMLAVWSRDGVAVAADSQLTDGELETIEEVFEPGWVIRGTNAGDPVVRGRAARPGPPLPPRTAVIKLTSGSTGEPRGIAVTADQITADASQIIAGMGITPDDTNVAVIPMSHSYGLSSLLLPLIVQGSPLVLVSLSLPANLAGALSIDEPAVFPGVPYLFDLLVRPGGPEFRRSGLRLCISAGAPLSSRTAAVFRERYGLAIRAFYGTSETGGLAFDASAAGDAAAVDEGCVGTPLPRVELSVLGTERRVVARSAAIACGYVARTPGMDSGGFRDGEFVTDDAGRFDASGRLHLTGRLGSQVNISGRKVDPREIERVLGDLSGVSEVLVASIPDDRRGQSLVAYLVADSGVTRASVMSHLRSRLASWKLPRNIVFLDSLPRTARGKLDRRALPGTGGDPGS